MKISFVPSTQNIAVKKIKQDFHYYGIYIAGNKQILVSAVKTVNQGNMIKVVRKGLSGDEI